MAVIQADPANTVKLVDVDSGEVDDDVRESARLKEGGGRLWIKVGSDQELGMDCSPRSGKSLDRALDRWCIFGCNPAL
jgi:hypothetical protein